MSVPRLSREDVRERLGELYKQRRNNHLFAFYGAGEEDTIRTDSAGTFRVVPVAGELQLRELMPPLQAVDERIAFLVPWEGSVPLDLSSRFALHGRVQRIGKLEQFARVFGVRELDDSVQKSALVPWLLEHGPSRVATTGGRLTEAAMWAAWLKQAWGVPAQEALALDELLSWAATDPRGPAFVEKLSGEPGAAVREELRAYLEGALGPVGPVVWTQWERGRGRELLAFALVCEPLASIKNSGIRVWRVGKARELTGVQKEHEADAVVQRLASAAGPAFRFYEKRAGAAEARSVLQEADALVDINDVRVALGSSTILPSAWALRLEALGLILAQGAKDRTAASTRSADEALRQVRAHQASLDASNATTLTRAEMAVRLLAWVAGPSPVAEPALSEHGDAEHLAAWYVDEGGLVDRARAWARGPDGDPLGAGIQAVVLAADAARAALDRRFAQSLKAWCAAHQPSHSALPIHLALERVVAKFVGQNDERRVLVILMDGMAWAQAHELLEGLEQWGRPWHPLRWHASSRGKCGPSRYPAVLAALPTVTEVSRAAFFAGRAMQPGEKLSTGDDPKRFSQNKAIAKFFTGNAAPKLLLRDKSHAADGSALPSALRLIRDRSEPIVGVVVNAIDASLKGDAQGRQVWGPDAIKSFADLLAAAYDAERSVLLAADHGHVPSDLLKSVGKPTRSSARYRELDDESEPAAEGEVVFTAAEAYVSKGTEAVALLTDDRQRYGGSAHAGEHGGASLAEVVAPCVLIGPDETTEGDPDRGVQPLYRPRWWFNEVGRSLDEGILDEESVDELAPTPKPEPKKTTPQMGLFDKPVAAPPAAAPSTPPPAVRAAALATNKLFEARTPAGKRFRAQVIHAVGYLVDNGGIGRSDALAVELNELPYRVSSLINRIADVLNVDGYAVMHFDSNTREIRLDQAKLEQQFKVKL